MNKKILMIDDDSDDQYLYRGLFTSLDSEVRVECRDSAESFFKEYSDSHQAVEFIPDLILLDLNLPKYKGSDIFVFIKKNHWLKAIPVLVLTTSSSPLDIQDCKNLRVDAYFIKPMNFNESKKLVETIYHYWFDYNALIGYLGE